MELAVLAQILVGALTEEQIDQILQKISDGIAKNYGRCQICDGAEYPVDAEGSEIPVGEDISGAVEWREYHEEECIVTLIENRRKGGNY